MIPHKKEERHTGARLLRPAGTGRELILYFNGKT